MKVNTTMLVVQVAGMFVVIGAALFLAAGTVAWAGGWAFLLLFSAFTVAISLWLLRNNPGLLNERLTGLGKSGQKGWDKVFFALAQLLFLGWLIANPLDAVRYRWSHVPGWLQVAGGLLVLASFYAFFLIFRENAFLSPAVRVQDERGQTVVATGPYRYVRHPMYSTAIVFLAASSLLMGSFYALLPLALLKLGIAWRAVGEEATLRAELPGYAEYMSRVRYRLMPGVW